MQPMPAIELACMETTATLLFAVTARPDGDRCGRWDMDRFDIRSADLIDSSCAKPIEPLLGTRQVPVVSRGDCDAKASGTRVLLVAEDGPTERSIVRILRKKRVPTGWARSVVQLRKRAARSDLKAPQVVFLDLELCDTSGEESVSLVRSRFADASVVAFGEHLNGERAARLLAVGVPSLHKPISPNALVDLALELCALRQHAQESSALAAEPGKEASGGLEVALQSYVAVRALSDQQRLILSLYLCGENDKQIAQTISCSEPTVYEHWRRMGRKAGGSAKFDVIVDFHRFLVRN